MDEYIKRESAVKAANEWVSEACKEPVMRVSRLFDKLQKVPVADVASVVRCKDCKYQDEVWNCCHPRHHGILLATYPLDFCSYGEKKGGDNNAKSNLALKILMFATAEVTRENVTIIQTKGEKK